MNVDDEILTTDEAIQFTRMGKQSFQKYYRGAWLEARIEQRDLPEKRFACPLG